jgi:hypothetical protein
MTVLEKSARNQLDKAVQAARRAATTGAERALQALSVEQEKKPAHLSSEQNELRRQLRVVCRRLGSWDALVRAVAYEQWHRMLFARFLAENNLLIHQKYHAAVTLDECAELARECGVDQWEVAAEFAAGMLPGIFQKDDPLLLLKFAPEDRATLEEILQGIPADTFCTQDALGWTYQFWQSEEKAKVNDSERKLEGADICAVTQLFTEPYMVQFLLQNTLGAWWLNLYSDSPLRKQWLYYKDQVQHDFSAFPTTIKELKILDPACGSGHFLVEAFHMLLTMRLEQGQEQTTAIKEIVRDNLHGLELDPRCIQIAGFAIALEAWKSGFPTDQYLPLPNLACTGLPIRTEKSEWLKLAAGDGLLEGELAKYYDLFKNADSLGSLIQIEEGSSLVPTDVLTQKLEAALTKEKAVGDPVAEAFGETASGVLKAVAYLRRNDFHIVVTNPPFLGYKKISAILKGYVDEIYEESKYDIGACFVYRCMLFQKNNCLCSLVNPQNWLFIGSYSGMRIHILHKTELKSIAMLGAHSFEQISGEVMKAILVIFQNKKPISDSQYLSFNCVNKKNAAEKADFIRSHQGLKFNQLKQLKNPDSRIQFETNENNPILSNYAICMRGIVTGDTDKWIRKFWEISRKSSRWRYHQSTVEKTVFFGGREHIIDWKSRGSGMLRPGTENQAYGKFGVAVSQMQQLPVTLYTGELYDNNVGPIVPLDPTHLHAIWAFCTSPDFFKSVRAIDQTLKVTNATLLKVPFDLSRWQEVAEKMGPLPQPQSDDLTQWLFKGNIIDSEQPLHVAIARMLGYRWPEQPAGEDPLDALVDKDGIVCIPPVWGERPAVDWLRSILASAYGSEWSPRKEEELLKQTGYTKNGGLEGFLRDEFFASHCKLFHQRPFIWQVWDGTRDGFSALLNYHKLDHNTLQKLIFTYLGNWITQQKDEVRQEKPGAEKRLAAAEELKKNLEKILDGEKPYDIYVRWKPLREQAIGWEPDLNDGVRMNIRPFIEAGVLRWTPNIKWGKDRGTDPVPNCSGTTERLNDLHISLEEKRKARENAGKVP